ncbi:phosphate signaling complex protein PhoU [Shouchella shacheensis]|uniref:phosphate signaling complex protein PhoU n=1 Tax=Shouchella shacheensis TaxID=1649580 RepID=UPI0007405151|nr:phosphate signaling complex protein PhoU [Shouchella shacheensis]
MRENFHLQLDSLKEDVHTISQMTIKAHQKANRCLTEHNNVLGNEVIREDKTINQKEETINEKAILLITREQPIASDLRRIIVALKVSNDIERIADYAVNIAKTAQRYNYDSFNDVLLPISKMNGVVREMLENTMEAYVKEDVNRALESAQKDNDIDQLYRQSVGKLMRVSAMNQNDSEGIMQLLLVCKYLERAGDHITNIAENILYLVNGTKMDLND